MKIVKIKKRAFYYSNFEEHNDNMISDISILHASDSTIRSTL